MPHRLGYLRIPILQALRFVHNQQVGAERPPYLHVIAGTVIGDNLIRLFDFVLDVALVNPAFDDMRFRSRETFDFLFPLVFQRSGTQD